MRSEHPSPESGADQRNIGTRILDDCETLRDALESSFSQGAISYRYQRDAEYREVRRRLLVNLQTEPQLATLAQGAEHMLPHSLARCAEIPVTWWINPSTGGRLQLIQFQAGILSLLEHGTKPSNIIEPVQPPSRNTPPAEVLGRVNRAQRRANEQKQRARHLRAENATIKHIARMLGCSERSVYNYLRDEHEDHRPGAQA